MLIAILLASGCTAQDQIAVVSPIDGAAQRTVLFATDRASIDGAFVGRTGTISTYGRACRSAAQKPT